MTPVPAKLAPAIRQWLSEAPAVDVDDEGDAFHSRALRWLGEWNEIARAHDAHQNQELLLWLTRYQMALLNSKDSGVSLGNDRLSQAFWAMIIAVVGAAIVATSPASTGDIVTAAAFVAIASGAVAVGHACYSVWNGVRKLRRNRQIQAIYDRVERIAQTLFG